MMSLLIRFLVGGVVVSLFALIAGLGPKSLAGIFGGHAGATTEHSHRR